MKSKGLKWVLMVLALVVWATIIGKIIGMIKKPVVINNETRQVVTKQPSVKKDTFSLSLNYSDPFGLRNSVIQPEEEKLHGNTTIQAKKKETQKTEIKAVWPTLRFNGLIYNNSTSKTTGLLTINKNKMLVTSGQTYDDIYIVSIYQDSIHLKLHDEFKTIIKN
jgi:hypothetical protein